MTQYFLKQAWCEKPFKNLRVSCGFSVTEEAVKAVFDITEPSVKARYSETNQKVYEDSCAELFLSFGNGFYYNFEVSCIGTVLAEYGRNRFERELLKPEIIKKIEVVSTLGNKPFGIRNEETSYRMEIKIPKQDRFPETSINAPTDRRRLIICICLISSVKNPISTDLSFSKNWLDFSPA